MTSDDTDVLIIGAGIAGLRCAAVLRAAGRDVRIWEASDDIGGRIRTDVIDGFRCDRGFQVLNPAYPELPRATDVSTLRLQPFGAGVAVRRDTGSTLWVHPLRQPTKVPA
nr:NAD(P)/FAD-dependent oxidoreductase [Actinomycetota bacterium]